MIGKVHMIGDSTIMPYAMSIQLSNETWMSAYIYNDNYKIEVYRYWKVGR